MRQSFLILAILSISAWSQPAQQHAQTPIVVKVQMPPTPQRDFLGYLQALGPLIAACVAVGVALMQWHIQKQNLKQQRFAKRFEVYQAVRRFLPAVVNTHATFQRAEYDAFRTGISPAKFLFGPDVSGFIDDITPSQRTAISLDGSYGEQLRWVDKAENVLDLPELNGDDDPQVKFEDLERRAESAFGPYLQLPSDEAWFERCIALADRWRNSLDKMMASRYDEH